MGWNLRVRVPVPDRGAGALVIAAQAAGLNLRITEMGAQAAEYRRRAEECERRAKEVKDVAARETIKLAAE